MAPLRGIALAPDIITAIAVTVAAVVVIMTNVIPKEAVLTGNTAGATPGGDLVPMTHHNPDHPDDTTTDHDLTEGIDLAAEASLDPCEDIIAASPILQIINVPGIP